jgi:hypothetical protein
VTAVSASSSGMPGSPSGRAELARPVKPSAARSSQPPSRSSSVPRQCRAAICSSSVIDSIRVMMAYARDCDVKRRFCCVP